MNAKRSRGSRGPDRAPDVSSGGTTVGTDYHVSYTLSDYQRGSMVLRFTSPPNARDLHTQLENYGISASQVKEVSAVPVPALRRQQADGSTQPAPPPTPPSMARQVNRSPAPAAKKKRGCVGPVLTVLLIGYLITAVQADGSFLDGRLSTAGGGFGERVSACTDSLTVHAQTLDEIWGGSPGPFTDRVSTFTLHPANAAYLAGCIFA